MNESALAPQPSADTSARPVGILVVDDHPEYLAAVCTFLTRLPRVRVVGTATNGRDAIRRVRELSPDLVLLDITMPEMDGLTAARAIKGRPGAPLVVIVTAEATLACSLAVAASGADALVCKSEAAERITVLVSQFFPAT